MVIDEGRYSGPFVVGASGNITTQINKDTYSTLRTDSIDNLLSDGWIVITAGASDGNLDQQARIDASVLEGKANNQYEGTVNSGFSLVAGKTNTYSIDTNQSLVTLFECQTTDLTQENACVILTSVASVNLVESTAGSYFFDSVANKLYVNASNSSNISTSIWDYEGIATNGYNLDIRNVNGIAFDGGATRKLRFSFGDSTRSNGIIENTQDTGNIIFRNLQILYSDNTGHVAHLMNDRLLISDSEIGKSVGNQSFTHSLISKSIYGFIINNTIWDGYESHGNTVDLDPIQDYVVANNIFKREKLTNLNDVGVLKFLTFSINSGGKILITGNSFPDAQKFLDNNPMSIMQLNDNLSEGTGDVEISNNTIQANNLATAIVIFGLKLSPVKNFSSIKVSGNTISGFKNTSQAAITLWPGSNNCLIESNTFSNNYWGVITTGNITPALTGLVFNNNSFTPLSSADSNVAAILLSSNSVTNYIIKNNFLYTPVGSSTNRGFTINSNTGTNIIKNNYFEGKLGNITFLSNSLSNTYNLYGNIFNGSDYGVRVFGSTAGVVNIYNNTFYKVKSAINLNNTSTISPTATNNVFLQSVTEAVNDNSATGKFTLNYNIYNGNTADITTEGSTPTTKGAHDITQDPLLVSPLTGNYRLQSTSPAINAGSDLSATFTDDYVGNTRPQGSAFDIGAYEYIPLSVTINQATGQTDPTNSSTVNFTVVFSESVSDFATGDVTLSGTAGATTATVTGSGTTYNVAVTGMVDSGTIIASISSGVAHNGDNNPNVSSTSTDNNITYDITPPTLTSITISDTTGYINNTTPTISIVSSASPTQAAFSCNGGSSWSSWITYADTISSFNITNGAIGCNTTNGNKTITAKLKDALGNESTTKSDTTYYDNTAPAIPGTPTTSNSITAQVKPAWSWTASTDSGSGLVSSGTYTLQWSTDSTFATGVNTTTADTNSFTHSIALSDGVWYFKVKANDTAGNSSDYSASGSVTIDTTSPTAFSLDSPGDNSYTNSERPSFKWKTSSNPDATSGLSKYKLDVDNGDSGDFTVDDIPTSRTTDYETDKYIIHYENFNDSDSTNNYISVYTKSTSQWGSDNNDGKLKEGKRNWKVTAYDNAGNTRDESRNLLVDRSSPNVEASQLNTAKITNTSITLKTTDTTPTIYGKIADSLVGDKTENKISSGPKSVEIKIEKLNNFGLYDLSTLATVNLTETYWTSNGNKISDNSQNTTDKYSNFEFTPTEKLPLGSYKITLTGKDNAGNTGGSTTINLKVTTLAQITTSEEKKIIDEETKNLTPKEKEQINKDLEITKQETTPTANKVSVIARLFSCISNFFGNFSKYFQEVAQNGKENFGQIAKSPKLFASRIGDWLSYSTVSFGEIVLDSKPTQISEVKVIKTTPTTAVIYWKTNHLATSKVNYGTTKDFGKDIQSSTKVHEHKIEITGLEPTTKYFYEVMSQNKNYVYDANHEFTTPKE